VIPFVVSVTKIGQFCRISCSCLSENGNFLPSSNFCNAAVTGLPGNRRLPGRPVTYITRCGLYYTTKPASGFLQYMPIAYRYQASSTSARRLHCTRSSSWLDNGVYYKNSQSWLAERTTRVRSTSLSCTRQASCIVKMGY